LHILKNLARRISARYAARAAKHGDLKSAERLWVAAIAYGDDSPETHRRLAELYLQSGNHERAVALLSVAASSAPSDAPLIAKLAEAYQASGELDKAKTHWLRVKELDPGTAPLLQLALIHHRQGDLDAAANFYGEVIGLDRSQTEAHLNLGKIHIAAARLDAAQACLDTALETSPHDPQILCCLGEVKGMQGDLDQAIAYFEKALAAEPDFGPALSDMGLAMQKKKDWPTAVKWLRDAIHVEPKNVNAWLTLGAAYQQLGQLDMAILTQERALALFPHHPQVLSSLGASHANSGNYSVAEMYFDRALAAAPDEVGARLNRAFILLVKGDYRQGFAEYEARLQQPDLKDFAADDRWPTWRGEPLAGKRIVVRTEQGFGDAIQFVRFAADLADQGATVFAETSPPLRRLLAAADGIASRGMDAEGNVQADFYCPIMSLPHKLGITRETLRANIPYFRLRAGDIGRWKEKLKACKPLKVGIAWASDPDNWLSVKKSIPLPKLLPALGVRGISFCSLQVGHGGELLKGLPDTIDIVDPTGELTDFYETACLIENLDLVITIDSAVAHLASALGKPTWILLHHAPDWRWQDEESGKRWYPSARLFRQAAPEDWDGVVATLAPALSQFALQRP
jgi:tetratricopeptide (TPR) repeat protein